MRSLLPADNILDIRLPPGLEQMKEVYTTFIFYFLFSYLTMQLFMDLAYT